MQRLLPLISKTLLSKTLVQRTCSITNPSSRIFLQVLAPRNFCSGNGSGNDPGSKLTDPWDHPWQSRQQNPDFDPSFERTDSSWNPRITEEESEEAVEAVGRPVENIDQGLISLEPNKEKGGKEKGSFEDSEVWAKIEQQYAENEKSMGSIEDRVEEMDILLRQVREPGLRGTYLMDSEKQEMYRLHKENPKVYTVERLAKDFKVLRQRVEAILWLKEDQEEIEKKTGPLDDSVEQLLDMIAVPEFANFADREFHVAQLPNNPDFKVMPENWDRTAKDPDEMLWEISQKEDEMLYQEFVQRMNYNKAKIAGKIKCHPYSRRRPNEGWKFTVEELGRKGKRGRGGGVKFVSLPDGSRRPLNELEKIFLKRETNRTRRKII
ncbi:hypothetical protein SUGI_0088660 [Cryptomeria japonica]|uniref:protein GAMETE CELL DEFECTIVE 1, mitochondrial n=1 Tax=Cryptomeria japonica TaxID=3369 RepID=UPI002408DCF9|nr:protein GAMETE CELL DEFECTIVE 1, mitochondrial [Cryptomeria japonica]GLJ08434.1 hypothetical protein SUGI_0088660 [Cryptomeria japonica]